MLHLCSDHGILKEHTNWGNRLDYDAFIAANKKKKDLVPRSGSRQAGNVSCEKKKKRKDVKMPCF